MNILDYCRQYSKLSAMQVNILYRISVVLPLVADLAHAHIAIYVRDKHEANKFVVVNTVHPHTTLNPRKENLLGKRIPAILEPVVKYSMDTKKKYKSLREVQFGKFLEMYTIPIVDHDNNEVIAVIAFDINTDDTKIQGYSRLLKTAFIILKNSQKNLDPRMFKAISSRDGVIITNKDERIIFANLVASRIYHVLGVNNLLGCYIFDHQLTMYITKETILHKRTYEKEIEAGNLVIIRRDIPIMEAGNLLTRIIILSDVTEIRKKDKELLIKSAVIQEIHHRVKNNLQTIASLLRLQARRSKSQEVKDALRESINRILSISVAHEFLSQQGDEKIDVVEVTKNILNMIKQNMVDSNFALATEFSGNTIILPSKQASNIALIINELILNSMEHGFEGRDKGTIGLAVSETKDAYVIELYDDGWGLPDDFGRKPSKSLGLQIIQTLVEGDMGGTFAMYNDEGTHARITIPYSSLMEDDVNV